MRRLGLACAGLALIAGAAAPALGQARHEHRGAEQAHRAPERARRGYADPSAVITAELAFARLAQEKGQWAAFAATAAPEAEMFVPQRVKAREWLKKRANPAVAVQWQPTEVWMSCDGSYAVTRGPWQRANAVGYFTTVWQRQKDGSYKWLLDQGDTLAQPLPAPEMISARVAECTPRPPAAPEATASPAGTDRKIGWSDDRTLQWLSQVAMDGSRSFTVRRWTGAGYDEVIHSEVAVEKR
ncbi:MAG: hypothetical protein JF593_03525 [Novosphingobium sp.]|nr:hypothetical protein [Novosphingobium sp.]